jgi:hypothetical protein
MHVEYQLRLDYRKTVNLKLAMVSNTVLGCRIWLMNYAWGDWFQIHYLLMENMDSYFISTIYYLGFVWI